MANTLKEYRGVIVFYLIIMLILVGMNYRSNQIDNHSKINNNIITTY